MENDQRLTPLPAVADLQAGHSEYAPGYLSGYDDTLEGKRSLRQYLNIVYKRLPVIIAITVLATAAVAFYSFRQPSIFLAQTEMIITPRKPQVTQKDAININFGDDQKYYNTQLQLLQNQDLMKRVVVSLGLHREPNLFGDQNRGLLAGIRSLFGAGQRTTATDNSLPVVSDASLDDSKAGELKLTPEEDARADLYSSILVGGLDVRQREGTNIVTVGVQSSNPALAAKVADRVAELFIKEDADRETAGAQKVYDDLGASIEDLKNNIAQQENDLLALQTSSNLPVLDKGTELRLENLKALQAQLNQAREDVTRIESAYRTASEAARNNDILPIASENKSIAELRTAQLRRREDAEHRKQELDKKIFDAKENLEKLLVKYTDNATQVKQARAQISELESQKQKVQKEIDEKITAEDKNLEQTAQREILTSLRGQLGAAQQRLNQATYAFDQATSRANVEGVAETRLTTLRDSLQKNRDLLGSLVQRHKEQELALASGRPDNIQIQNHAVTPSGPIGPQRTRNILVALLLSFAAGIGLAFLLDYLDDSVRTSDDISRHVGLPTLALIPHHLTSDNRLKLLSPKNGNGAAPSGAALIAMEERHSPMAEAYRHLRTSLLFSSAGKPPQTILVTSSAPSEGKTTTAINTAITLAQSDADVVIIDCDLRRPRLHSHFGLENTQGLTNYLSGDKDTTNLIRTYPELPRLKIVTSGPIPPNPAELLSSNEMRNLLQFLSGRFKHVIIDSPPAISFTDAAILSTLVDGVVLVAMANKSSIHLMRQFKQRIHNIGARIYGVVLNGIKAGSMEYDYYGSGYYKYYSHDDDESTPRMEGTR